MGEERGGGEGRRGGEGEEVRERGSEGEVLPWIMPRNAIEISRRRRERSVH